MGRRPAEQRIDRLEALQGLLASRDALTLQEAATELAVSVRTVARDIALLRRRGIAIEADRGRGGGTRLARGGMLGGISLSSAEAIDLLLSLAIAEEMKSPLLLQSLRGIRRKVAAIFPRHERSRILSLRKRIRVGAPASLAVRESLKPVKARLMPTLTEAFLGLTCLDIRYVNEAGEQSERRIEPSYFVFNAPVWYLLAWDHRHQAFRYFRFDRLISVEKTTLSFRMNRPEPDFDNEGSGFRDL